MIVTKRRDPWHTYPFTPNVRAALKDAIRISTRDCMLSIIARSYEARQGIDLLNFSSSSLGEITVAIEEPATRSARSALSKSTLLGRVNYVKTRLVLLSFSSFVRLFFLYRNGHANCGCNYISRQCGNGSRSSRASVACNADGRIEIRSHSAAAAPRASKWEGESIAGPTRGKKCIFVDWIRE